MKISAKAAGTKAHQGARRDDLVFGVGLHEGEDTAFYLRKGFRVVAFEADPSSIALCKARFAQAVAAGALIIVEGAIAPTSAGAGVTFHRSSLSVWEMIDVEGVDTVMLEALERQPGRPTYVSIESTMKHLDALRDEVALLGWLGYRSFKLAQQATFPGTRLRTRDRRGEMFEHVFADHAPRPFGEDLPGRWRSAPKALPDHGSVFRRYRLFGRGAPPRRLLRPRELRILSRLLGRPLPGWCDTHARLGEG